MPRRVKVTSHTSMNTDIGLYFFCSAHIRSQFITQNTVVRLKHHANARDPTIVSDSLLKSAFSATRLLSTCMPNTLDMHFENKQ